MINNPFITPLSGKSLRLRGALQGFPGIGQPQAGDFTPLATSPNIDRGVLIPDINDKFKGDGPDVGANEYGS